jgi:hypothetical protein
MKSIIAYALAFFAGVIFTLIAVQGTFRDLRFAFSPSLEFANVGSLNEQGQIEGQGRLEWSNGDKYDGEFVAGKMHGQGVFVDSQGNRYSGEFNEGNFTGSGSFTSSEGFTYVGEFERWRLNGKAVQTDKDGNQWEGNYLNGQLHGAGSFVGKDGVQYTGEFRFGQYDGEGKLISAEGDIYEGEFSYGHKHGKGVLTYKKPIDGISRIEGRWHMGNLIDGGKDLKIYSPGEVVEYALYQNARELQLALDAVQPSDPNKIELYSLVVAGFGTEEVFRRESKMIENLFNAQYGNRATAIYLANSQRSLDERPMATLTSISAAIKRIADRMDKEKDIFFLYITSHGSQDKKISLHHNGLQLADIDSKWLAEQLKASGIKHRVIALSACYSGGFIEDLKDEHSLIMTAAAADKTSFGCADDSLSTYFGRAYFQESLKPGVDFEQAFYHAKALIETWEQEKKLVPSEPQIIPNANVLKQLKLWQKELDSSFLVDLNP